MTLENSTEHTQELSLGIKLRQARKEKGLSLQALAELANLSIGVISQIERGLTSPSFRSLRRLTSALGIPMRQFFEDAPSVEPESHGVVVHPRNRRILRLEQKGITTEYINPDCSGLLQMMLISIEPGGNTGEDYDTHDGEEGGLVQSGTLELILNGQHHFLQEGDSFRFPATTPHRFGNPGPSLTRVVWFITPPLC